MTHELYSESDNWEVESADQDVRGWNVVGEQGQQLGTVRDMYVDTQTETIDRLVLDNGAEVDVSTVLIDEGTIRVGGMGGAMSGTTSEAMAGTTPGAISGMTSGAISGADRQDMSRGTATTDAAARIDNDGSTTDRDDTWRIRRHQNQGDANVRESGQR